MSESRIDKSGGTKAATRRGADPYLTLKATPPRLPATLVTRTRLALTSPALSQKSIITIEAPAGFGKTSLLAQWRREALQGGSVAAWLNLDSQDDSGRLLQGLATAMRLASGNQDAFAPFLFPGSSAGEDLEGLTGWLAEVANLAVDTVLMLDDCHHLPRVVIDQALNYLVQNAPPNLTVILAARKPLRLSLADLLAHGRHARIDTESLRFSAHEANELLETRFGARMSPDDRMRLFDLTEGWPLGLQLATATIEGSQDLRSAIETFSARSGDIQRYFVDCLVGGLDPELSEFLTGVAFVDALHPDLCTAITGREDSPALLARLRDETPIFLQTADSEWLRFHSLALEFLKDRFAARPEAERLRHHARAARWFEAQGLFEAATRQALRAGETERAYELMAQCIYEIIRGGQVSRVAEWIERVPPDEIEQRPALRLAAGWTLAQSERHAEAVELLEPLINDSRADIGMRGEAAEICATAAVFMDDLESMRQTMEPWLESASDGTADQRMVATSIQAVQALFEGAPERARYLYAQLPSNSEAEAGAYALGWSHWIQALARLWTGQARLAEESLRGPLARAESATGRRSPVSATLAATLAATLWDRDQPTEAAELLANRLDVLLRRGAPDAIILGYITAARLATAEGLERRAWDVLEYLHAVGESRDLVRLSLASLAEQIRMHALRAHRDECARLGARLESTFQNAVAKLGPTLLPLVRMQTAIAGAYVAAADEDWPEVLARLEPAHSIAREIGRGRETIQVNLLRALALRRTGEDGTGLLNESVDRAATLGLDRLLADTHPDLADWVRRVQGPSTMADAGTLLEETPAPPVAPSAPAATARVYPSALLTPKEREVLQLLSGNMSNKQIALAMGISGETVKWHLKNLFGKLHAGTRKHLLDRARMLGILDFAG